MCFDLPENLEVCLVDLFEPYQKEFVGVFDIVENSCFELFVCNISVC